MITRYRILAERLRRELGNLARVVDQAEGAWGRTEQQPADAAYFVAAAAFELHSAYAAIERMFELIAADVDLSRPAGSTWRRELLLQMTLTVPGVRPPVISADTSAALIVIS